MSGDEIAIVGMAGRFPGAAGIPAFWANLLAGRECLGPAGRSEPGPAGAESRWVRAETLLPDAELFDAGFFGLSPREAEMTEPQHRLLLELSWEALEDAGYVVGEAGAPVGVFAGANFTSYFAIAKGQHILEVLPSMIGADKDYLATRISFRLNLTGPSLAVQSACSTSLAATHLACQSLIAGECDAALAGGASITTPRNVRQLYMPGGILSPDGYCRPFDTDAQGTIFSEGAGMVLLMRHEDALAQRRRVYALIRGSAMNNDGGAKAGYTAPSVAGQVAVIRQAQAVAGLSPADIGYVEAHGAGTVLGDAIETAALVQAFGEGMAQGACRLGSVKGNIGHLASAAGVAGLIKTALSLEHGVIPGSANFTAVNPDLRLEASPFQVADVLRPWPAEAPRNAGVSSFGVGGTNVHIVVGEAPRAERAATRRTWHALPVSGRSAVAVQAAAEALQGRLEEAGGPELADAAFTLSRGRTRFEHRGVLLVSGDAPGRTWRAPAPAGTPAGRPPRIAFAFPGQGAQAAQMGLALYRTEPAFAAAMDRCFAAADRRLDFDLRDALYGEPGAHDLTRTALAQPALFATEYALAELLAEWGVRPDMAVGHSLGEYAAACLAGVLSLDDALWLVGRRGALMQALPPGGMLSILAPFDRIAARLPEGLDCAAINGPEQCVVSGPHAAIAEMEAACRVDGLACRRLQTSHAFHSAMMQPALAPFAEAMAGVRLGAPRFPYASNVTGRFVAEAEWRDPAYWAAQIRRPVAFRQGVQSLLDAGADLIVEVGPGRQLAGLAHACGVPHERIVSLMPAPGGPDEALDFGAALGRLWAAGAEVDWDAPYAGEDRRFTSLPTYPFERSRYWLEPAAVGASGADAGRAAPDQWLYAPGWRAAPPPPAAAQDEAPEPVLVLAQDGPAGEAIARLLRAEGTRAAVLDLSALAGPALRPAVAAAVGQGDGPLRVIYVAPPPRADGTEAAGFRAGQDGGLFGLLRAFAGLRDAGAGADRPLQLDIVGSGLFDVIGDEPLAPELAPLLAFAAVAPQEHPQVRCRVIDTDTDPAAPGAALAALRRELAAGPQAGPRVALRNRRRWLPDFGKVAPSLAAPRLKPRGVYLITGGFGEIGLIFAAHLARACQARLVLMGRTALPPRQAWDAWLADADAPPDLIARLAAIRRLEAAGGEVHPFQGDVAEPADMARLRAFVQDDLGGLDGAILAAGQLGLNSTLFREEDVADYENHFRGKTLGVAGFIDAFGDAPLDFCHIASSLSAVLGGLGHCAYAAANMAADALVRRRNRGRDDLWTTCNWDLWLTGATAAAGAVGRIAGDAITPQEGAATLDCLLRLAGLPQVVISTRDLPAAYDKWIVGAGGAPAAPAEAHARPELATAYEEPQGELEDRIAGLWKAALGVDRVGRHDDFLELGGHSLLTVQVLADISAAFGVETPIDAAFQATTVAALAALVEGLIADQIDGLSEEEAERLLALEAAP